MDSMAHLGVHRHSQNVRTRWWGIMLVGAFLALGAQEAVAEAASSTPRPVSRILWVGFQNGLLSLEAKDVPAQRVLNDVCAKTGVVLQASVPLKGSVTASFKDLPVEPAFRRLFGSDVNFIFLYHGQKPASGSVAVPAEVWVLAKGMGEAPQTAKTPNDKEAVAPSAAGDSQHPTQAIERAFERNPLVAQNAAVGSRSQEVRLKAIAYLGQQPTRDSVDVLMKVAILESDGRASHTTECFGCLDEAGAKQSTGARDLSTTCKDHRRSRDAAARRRHSGDSSGAHGQGGGIR